MSLPRSCEPASTTNLRFNCNGGEQVFTNIDKFLMSLLPLVTMLGGYLGFDVTPEWWTAVVAALAPILVWVIPNKGASS